MPSPPKPESDLVIRVRDHLAGKRGITSNRMFGGTCFYANGNLGSWLQRGLAHARSLPPKKKGAPPLGKGSAKKAAKKAQRGTRKRS